MSSRDQQRWDARYKDRPLNPQAADVLLSNSHLLPERGRSLDVACGFAGNAILLAERALESHAWDISAVVIDKLTDYCATQALVLHAQQRDIILSPPAADSFDVIVVTRFLDRRICAAIEGALSDNGLLFYQTFTRSLVDTGPSVPGNDAYCLRRGELLELFKGLQPLAYREDDTAGDHRLGLRNEAYLVARKRPA